MADTGNQISTSMYPTQPAVPLDPFGAMSKAAGLTGQMNQNRLFNQMYNSNLAVSNAYKQSLNPDGSINTQALPGNVVRSGATVNLPEAVNSAISSRAGMANATTAEAGASDAQLSNARAKTSLADSVLYPTLSDPNATYGNSVNAAKNLFKTYPNLYSPQEQAYFLKQIPEAGGASALNDFATNFHARAMDPTSAASFLSPQPQAVNQGPQSTIINVNPRRNPGLIGTVVPQALTPEAGSAPMAGPVVNGQPTTLTRQQNIDLAAGNATLGQNGQLVYKPGYTPGAVPPIQPGSGGAPAVKPIAGAPVASSVVPSGAPLGQEAAAGGVAAGNAAEIVNLQHLAGDAPNQKAALNNLSQKLDQFTAGPLASKINEAKATWNQVAGGTGLPKFDPESIAAQEDFAKIATSIAGQQSAALGMSTDAGRYLAQHSNPSELLSTQGNKEILPMLKGGQDAITAKNEAWQQYRAANGGNDNLYPQFSAQFNRTFSPRVFQFPYMAADQRTEMLKSMTGQEKQQYRGALDAAEKNGWLTQGSQ